MPPIPSTDRADPTDVEVVGVGLLHHEIGGGEEKEEHRHGDGECLDRADG
jgi:hypothetical protein